MNLKYTFFGVILIAMALAVFALQRANHQLRLQANELRIQSDHLAHDPDEMISLQRKQDELRTANGAEDADKRRAELSRMKTEINQLERHAVEEYTKEKASRDVVNNNRDPESGKMPLENFKNVGRATPITAFQTLVWAAVTGDESVLASGVLFEAAARKRAEVLLASLPASAQSQYGDINKLAALVFSDLVLDQSTLQVTGQQMVDDHRATLMIRANTESKEIKLPMILGESGWGIALPQAGVNALERKLTSTSREAGRK